MTHGPRPLNDALLWERPHLPRPSHTMWQAPVGTKRPDACAVRLPGTRNVSKQKVSSKSGNSPSTGEINSTDINKTKLQQAQGFFPSAGFLAGQDGHVEAGQVDTPLKR